MSHILLYILVHIIPMDSWLPNSTQQTEQGNLLPYGDLESNLPSTSSFITKEGGPRPSSWLEGAGSLRKGNQLNYQVTFTSAGPQHCLWSQQFWFVELLTPKFHLQNPEHNLPPSYFRRDLQKKIIAKVSSHAVQQSNGWLALFSLFVVRSCVSMVSSPCTAYIVRSIR